MNHKKRKVLLGIILVILIVLGIGSLFLDKTGKQDSMSLVYIPKIIDDKNDFWTSLISGAETAAEEYGIHLEVTAPQNETDYEGQNLLIREILERKEKPDALLISPISYTESTKLLEQVKERGISLVMIDSNVDKDIADLMVATDNLEAGKKLGEYTASLLEEGKKAAVIGHVQMTSTAMEREKGFLQGLGEKKEAFTEIVYCGSQYEKAYELAMELIRKYPELTVIAGLNEYSAMGAARAIRDAGVQEKIHMVGIDSSQEGISLMEQGVFKGIVVQKPFKMGYLGVKYTIEMLDGKNLPARINAGSELVTVENMYMSENEKLLFPFDEN